MRVGDANAAANTGSGDGVTSCGAASALSMRTSWAPVFVVARQLVGLTQRTLPRSRPPMPRSCGVQVVPPSAVVRYRPPSPAATPCSASTNVSERTARVVVLTSVHELAPSTVR